MNRKLTKYWKHQSTTTKSRYHSIPWHCSTKIRFFSEISHYTGHQPVALDLGTPRNLCYISFLCISTNNNRNLPAFVESMSSDDWDPLGHLYFDAVFLEFSATWKVAAWCREINKSPLKPTVTYTRKIACIGLAEFRVLIQTEKSLDDLSTKSLAYQLPEQSNIDVRKLKY